MILYVLAAVALVAIIALNIAALWALTRRAGGQPAPGDGQAPVPGNALPQSSGAADPPPRPAPAPGCSLCGWWPAYRPDLRLWVMRYERCPAHQTRERQP